MNKGSVWRKWDLHIHTPESFRHEFRFINREEKEKYNNNIWAKYIDELDKISDVSVISITDYFTIDGYKKVLEYKENGKLQNFDRILPNIELRLDRIVADKRLNYHVIFSDELESDEIEEEFLKELHINTHIGEKRPLTKKNIVEIGNILKEHQKNFRNKSDYVIGCENIFVSLDEIIKILKSKESIFAGKYLLVLVEEGWDSINWAGQNHLTRKEILVRSHAIFSSNPNTKDWALGKKHSNTEGFIKEFGSIKPCIHGSDAHSFERLCKPDEDRYCWIKADPTFEGLKQIIYEPEDRIKIQPENPEYRKNIYTLNSIKINNSCISEELSIDEQDIALNNNLVAITGGKGEGKTALLDLIANCFEDRCKREHEDRNSFVQRIEEQKPDLQVEIGFVGEYVENFSKELVEEEFFQDSKITYLPQGKIEEYSGDREKLDEKIEEIIFNNKEVIDRGDKQEFDRLRDEINLPIKEISQINIDICKLEEETKKEIINEIESKKGIKDGELQNKEDELRNLTKSLEEGIREKISKLKEEETEFRTKHSKFEDIKSKLEQFRIELEEFLDSSNNTIGYLNYELSKLKVNLKITQMDFKPQLDAISKILKLITQEIKDIIKQTNEKKEQLSHLSGVEKTHAELLKDIESIKTTIDDFQKQLTKLKVKKEELKSLESERVKKYQDLLNKYLEWKEYYEEVIKTFSKGKTEIMGGIDFKSSIYFDKKRFIALGSDILDQRRINIDDIEKYAGDLEAIIIENAQKISIDRLEVLIKKIFKTKKYIKETRTNYDFYNWVFDSYFSLSTKILFKGRVMDKLSIGQKGTVLLKLFLAEGDYPLIVDQPEESLDNKFIYEELVKAIRSAKKNRQVLIATNNANLVVNTDAEQIIVAKFENNRIAYKLGSLEDLKIRDEIMPILEGGKEAFRKREEKYGI